MPFQSKAQRRYMHAKHPEIANRWEREYKTPKNLPDHKPSKDAMKTVVSGYSANIKKKRGK